jgi:hypothetical protein
VPTAGWCTLYDCEDCGFNADETKMTYFRCGGDDAIILNLKLLCTLSFEKLIFLFCVYQTSLCNRLLELRDKTDRFKLDLRKNELLMALSEGLLHYPDNTLKERFKRTIHAYTFA